VVIASRVLREARRRNRVKFTLVPLAVALGSLALGYAIGVSGGFPREFPLTSAQSLWVLYLALFWIGHFWHFGNQDFGVLSIYRAKAGQTALRDRKIDKAYAVAMMFVIQPCVYFSAVTRSPLAEAVRSFAPIPPELVAIAAACAAAAAIVLTAAVIGYELRKPNPSLPKLAYYLVMLAHPLVLYFIRWRLASYYLIVYFFSHWLIAIGLTARIHTNFHRAAGASPARARLRHATRLGGFVAAASLFYAAFGRYSVFSGSDYRAVLSAVFPDWTGVVGLILGAFLAEQLLHYYCDRCLFRFRDADVRRALRPVDVRSLAARNHPMVFARLRLAARNLRRIARPRGLVGLADLPLVVRRRGHALLLAVRRRDDLDGLREELRRGLRPELGALWAAGGGLHVPALDVRDDSRQRAATRAAGTRARDAALGPGAAGGEPVRGARAHPRALHGTRGSAFFVRGGAHRRLFPARALVADGHGVGAASS
jgi:hypothetical protein